MKEILSYTAEQLKEYIEEIGYETYRAGIVFSWLHQKQVTTFDAMSNLPKQLRNTLQQDTYIDTLTTQAVVESKDGTVKYLFKLSDGNLIESVALFYRKKLTVCISSQVGCARNCSFCASAIGGLVRNLTPAEMLLQVYAVAADRHQRVSGVVLMGIGEPLDNFCNVMAFCDIICDENGLNLSQRAITISTSGVADRIEQLAEKNLKYNLSVSLHAANNALRSRLMPINDIYDLNRLMTSCQGYLEKTNRRITFEYAVNQGINDSVKDARDIYRLLKGMNAHINLIPLNDIEGSGVTATTRKVALSFKDKLQALSLNTTVRRTLGDDIDAACGQLRRRVQDETDKERLE
ncbi:MAG: 23S rRNA (adenine(2503)-C(2))-methyltransferase RlmN [Oscillospiraceae bacterium]|nr:23S rRNA (adenine(2503)-C(2))-methyltransferase RlmN [Oscillospiraceae bacterium]